MEKIETNRSLMKDRNHPGGSSLKYSVEDDLKDEESLPEEKDENKD